MSNKIYWNSLEQLDGDKDFLKNAQNEFAQEIPVEEFLGNDKLASTNTSRRDFLKFMGFSVAAATLAACETPVIKSIPYVVKPAQITPGVPNYYASTFFDGFDFATIVVKTREGRPIHIEGNRKDTITGGAINARINSSVLGLYDSNRLSAPKNKDGFVSWADLDKAVIEKLVQAKEKGGAIRILSSTLASPSFNAVLENFKLAFGGDTVVKVVEYDAYSSSAMLDANLEDFGKRAIPDYRFDRAKVIASVGADFLNSWLFGHKYAADYTKTRKPENNWMSKHYQFEANMSLTGSNADVRAAVKPSEYASVLASLYNELSKLAGLSTINQAEIDNDNSAKEKIKECAAQLWANKGESLVVCGSNDKAEQQAVNAINSLLGNYGSTISFGQSLKTRNGNDAEVLSLVKELNSGSVDVLIINNTNPVYSLPSGLGFADAISKAGISVCISDTETETSVLCSYQAASNHYLESWGDVEFMTGCYSITQPTIRNIYKTRQAQASFMTWAGLGSDYYAFLKSFWEENILKSSVDLSSLTSAWKQLLHEGVYTTSNNEFSEPAYQGSTDKWANALKAPQSGLEVEFYLSTALGTGTQANNPWLHELPDPITRVTWDNYITMNPTDMVGKYNAKIAQESPANVAELEVNGQKVKLPVVAQPGQKIGTVGVALGYGREVSGKVGKGLGQNVFPLFTANGYFEPRVVNVNINATGEEYPIASIQTHHTMMGRKIVNETTLDVFKGKDKSEWNPDAMLADAYGRKTAVNKLNLWEDHNIAKGHRWGLTIDLNTCIGCGACVTACHSENNVPVVGKDEIRRTRSMSWLRIDRYFSSDADPVGHGHGVKKDYAAMEVPSAYPQAVFQPIMCQHCNHAPCETVCPVAATTHSNEGLNQMTYNRCIGTRYCANNCPYKVRRFNWFNYVGNERFASFNPSQDSIGRMVLNPDVTVRARGVMEKCSMCVQRIQAGKLNAKVNGRPVQDGEVQTACSAACSTGAIKFGDLNQKDSQVRNEAANPRSYNLLEEIGTQPNVFYLTKVRNLEQNTNNA